MTDDILVAGGYGTVGRAVCKLLAERTSGRVLAAGRTIGNARSFADAADGVHPAEIDISDLSAYDDVLDGIDTVVMCLDADTPAFAKRCFQKGINYVDVSPTDALLRKIEAFDTTAHDRGARGILSVGLSPGMTNLFVGEALDSFDTIERVDITLGLGIGEAFGPDTIKWLIEDAIEPFSVRHEGAYRQVQAFSDPRTVDLPAWGRRTVYRANLADQHVLARTTSIPTIETRMGYDVRFFTVGISFLHRVGLFKTLVSVLGARRLSALMQAVPIGRDDSVVQTEVTGTVGNERAIQTQWIRGPDQARATALVAAMAVRRIHQTQTDAGVHHLHEVFALAPFAECLRTHGYVVDCTCRSL